MKGPYVLFDNANRSNMDIFSGHTESGHHKNSSGQEFAGTATSRNLITAPPSVTIKDSSSPISTNRPLADSKFFENFYRSVNHH